MNMDISDKERDLLKKILNSYLSDLRVEIRETKGDKSMLHEEENLIKGLLQRLS